MRKLMIGCTALAMTAASWSAAHAQGTKDMSRDMVKDAPKAAPGGYDVRYFSSLGDLLGDLPVDAFIRETRSGGKLISAVLDVCYSVSTTSDRKDRFAIELKPDGDRLTGSGQSSETKTPVSVSLTRRPSGKLVSFDGKITLGGAVNSISSPDNSDSDEKEFQQLQMADDDLTEAPKDFTQVSPQSLAVRVKRENFVDLVKSLRDKNVQVAFDSLATDCNALRTGQQVLRLVVDPARAAGLVASLRSAPGVTAAGWTSGGYDMERAIRFPAAGWSEGGKLDRDRLATALAAATAKVMSATPAAARWNDTTGELTFTLKRPSQLAPGLDLVETLEITALVGPERPGATDRLVLWLGVPASRTADESAGPHLDISDDSGGDEENMASDDDGMIRALAAELKGQRWDSDKNAWK
ncbi:MAG: hypothetical protein J0G37_02200 [Afipia sp.]|jgi:hypothetical protein|nr:hypothetical protein [Afipia sp.]